MKFGFLEFFRINHTPNPANIINTEWNRKDCGSVVVACSETESVRGSVVVKNGFNALRYLWLGNGMNCESEPNIRKLEPRSIIANKKSNPFLFLEFSLLLFWIKIQVTKKIVGIINDKPPNPIMKCVPSLSNAKDVIIVEIVKRGIIHIRNLWSVRKNGKVNMKIPIGRIKNWLPPHADKLNINKIPAPINVGIIIL